MKGPPSDPKRPRISVQMTDLDIIQRVSGLFGMKYVYAKQDNRNPRWKPYYLVTLRGPKAVELMKTLHPLMGSRRQQQITDALASVLSP